MAALFGNSDVNLEICCTLHEGRFVRYSAIGSRILAALWLNVRFSIRIAEDGLARSRFCICEIRNPNTSGMGSEPTSDPSHASCAALCARGEAYLSAWPS